MKFRKKPLVVEAFQIILDTVESLERFPDWFFQSHSNVDPVNGYVSFSGDMTYIKIGTLEGEMKVSAGDWIIKGTAGELYPCKDSIFQEIYEKVEEKDE